jgi:TolA-binding protein
MRKVTLTVVGLLGLSLLLCGSDEVLAQTDTRAFPPGSPGSDATDSRLQGTPSVDVDAGTGGAGAVATETGQAAGGAGASSTELQQTVQQLQGEVARLQQELALAREQLANVTRNNTGAGGAGQAGVAPTPTPTGASAGQNTPASGEPGQGAVPGGTTSQGTAPTAGTSPSTAQRGTQAGATNDPGAAVVHAIYRGKVRSVSNRQLVLIDDSGQPFTVELGAQTRFISKGQRISAQELKQGTRVRATVDLLSGHNQAMEVATLPER